MGKTGFAKQRASNALLTRVKGGGDGVLRSKRASNGRKKSIDLPHGRAGFRKSQETIEIVNQDAAVDWAKENCPDALRKKEWVIKTPLIEKMKENGELPDGCEHKPSEDKFYIS